jgi:hypothetical protein
MNRIDLTDNMLRNVVTNDNPEIIPDEAIEKRLNYHFLLRNSSQKVHSNSFFGSLVWFASLKSVGIKTAFVSLCFVGCLLLGNIKNNDQRLELSDTCHVSPQLVDSFYMVRDSCK